MSKEPVVKRGAKKPAAKKPVVKLPAKKASTQQLTVMPLNVQKVAPPPPKEFDDGLTTMERLLQLAGSITDEEAEDLMEALRQNRAEGCEA
jgi:hypothetical protein